ncbi:MAG: hypothetical protein MJD61_01995 [Proteobacteria bacterium]|nr:hypothetical protein [Pseudomonadota bacterium]
MRLRSPLAKHESQPNQSLATVIGVAASIALHAAAAALLGWVGTLPDVGFEVRFPAHVEFGVIEATPVDSTGEPASSTDGHGLQARPNERGDRLTSDKAETERSGEGGPKARRPREPQRNREATHTAPHEQLDIASRQLRALASASGTHLALRLNLARIRASPLVEDVRGFLEAVPDWRAVLAGSGVDPIADLERLFIASPDLQRSHLVIAGASANAHRRARQAVERLSRRRGRPATWRRSGRYLTAAWLNEDSTRRVLTLLDRKHFAITRPRDLPRLIAVGRALRRRLANTNAARQGQRSPAQALLRLEDRSSALEFSVEGARHFVRGDTTQIPIRMRLSLVQRDGRVAAIAALQYDTGAQAGRASLFWDSLRQRFAAQPLVRLMGLGTPLSAGIIERDEALVRGRTELNFQQFRVLLGFLRGALQRSQPGTPPDATGDSPN